MASEESTPAPTPAWNRPVEFRYTIAFDSANWRKVHPPHLAEAMAAGFAAIKAHLEGVSPYPYSPTIRSEGTYSDTMWSSHDWPEED